MAQMLVNRHSDDVDALVLTGTAYRMPAHMEAGDLNKRHKTLGTTGYEWLSRDASVAAEFAADPLTFDAKVLKLFGVADGLRLYGRPARGIRDLPLLVMIGEEDSLGGPKSARMLVAAYRKRSGLTDTQLVIYPGARHEVFNETNRAEVFADLVRWLDVRFPARV
jgi:alpha-beta hydrolase superfamily lysophospholipase